MQGFHLVAILQGLLLGSSLGACASGADGAAAGQPAGDVPGLIQAGQAGIGGGAGVTAGLGAAGGVAGQAGSAGVPLPAPTEPTPVEPTPVEPTPVEPTPTEPVPVEPTPANPDDPFDALRQLCVDTVNDYRATLSLPPLTRATAQESCSDQGAEKDGVSGSAHSSAGDCPGLGGQNTCPGVRVGGFGAATIEDGMLRCLQQMWDEGEPPVPRADCQRDYVGCFLSHGHYLNMSDSRYGQVACGFYEMSPGVYWMNQNFGW